jgi:hypothetical protein
MSAVGSCRHEERLHNNQLDKRPKRGVTLGNIPMRGGGTFNDDTPPCLQRKRAMARAKRAMGMVTRVAGNEKGDGKGGKGYGDEGEGAGEGEGKGVMATRVTGNK